MRHSLRGRAPGLIALVAAIACTGCYDPPVTEAILLEFGQDGRITILVETTFKRTGELKPAEKEEIQRVLTLYDLGRDPWLRGFERAGAVGVTHERTGSPGEPSGITRSAVLPSVEAIVLAMPDAIANFRLLHDDRDGTATLRITHIDVPESLRENRHRIEKEVESLAKVGYEYSDAHCDLYDYLASHVERRQDVLQALEDEDRIEGVLTPGETVLIRRLSSALEALTAFGEQATPPAMAGMSFAPFDHDLCLRLPPGAEMIDPGGFIAGGSDQTRRTWCAPRLTLSDLLEDAFPRAEPDLLDETIREDAVRLAAAPFSCVRPPDESALARRILERILPRARYEVIWKNGKATD